MVTGYFPRVKGPGRGVDHPSGAEFKERAELFLYYLLGFHGLFWGKLYLNLTIRAFYWTD